MSLSAFTGTAIASPKTETKLLTAFKKDPHPKKVFLAERECLNEDGQVSVLPLIQKIKQQLINDATLEAKYSPSLGLPEFNRRAAELALGKDCKALVEGRVLGLQTIGCAGAVRLGAELLKRWYTTSTNWTGPIYLPSYCDESLANTLKVAGIEEVHYYRFWSEEKHCILVEHLMEDLDQAPLQAVVVVPASAHYPTGVALTQLQWKIISQVMQRRQLFPFFLLTAHGLCLGNTEQEAWGLRYCASLGMELLCAQSFSHSFGLYEDRVGHLLSILKDNSLILAVQSQLESLILNLWSCPSGIGARVVATVLSNPAHVFEWQDGVQAIAEQCMLIRERLKEKLRLLGCPGKWDHLTEQIGLYSCLGLSDLQVDYLVNVRHVYLTPSSSVNVTVINNHNLDYIAESIYLALISAS